MNVALCHQTDPHDNVELRQLTQDDQALRHGNGGVANDATRLARVLALYDADSIRTAADFSNASLILQHGRRPEHYVLAQEFTVLSIGLGCSGLQAQFMVPATYYRFISSLGLNPDFLKDAARSGLTLSSGFTIQSGPQAFQSVPLSMTLLAQRQQVLQQLGVLRQHYPEYPWHIFGAANAFDSVLTFVTRTPDVATVFAQAHMAPQQWDSVKDAIHGAIDYAFFKPIVPHPMASVTGALGFSPIGAQNIDFVVAHQKELQTLGYTVDLIPPEISELARTHFVPVTLPPDTQAMAWQDLCPVPSAAHDTLADNADNPELLHLTEQLSRTGHSARTSTSGALRSARLFILLQTHAVRTPRDIMRAAIVSESGSQPEDAFRAHNLAVAAVATCGTHALQLAAATEDRFLALLGLQQRFGTLPSALVPIDTGPARVTDWTRHLMGVAPLPGI